MVNIFKGILSAFIASFLLAIIFAFLFRFPVPLAGYVGPVDAISTYPNEIGDIYETISDVSIAWLFYVAFWGFAALILAGGVTGYYIGKKYSNSERKNVKIFIWSFVVTVVPVFFLSISDYIIGPW